MAVVMMAAPHEYQMILATEQRAKGTGLYTLSNINIESAMSQQWRSIYSERLKQNLGNNDDCNSEMGLTEQFNGTCYHCGQ